MASLDWSQCPVVESIPGKVSGAWVFRGTRVPVAAIFENLKNSPIEEVLENFHVTLPISPDGYKIIADTDRPNEMWILENFEPKQ
jgi:uncharacterized protein (DUF433 family)